MWPASEGIWKFLNVDHVPHQGAPVKWGHLHSFFDSLINKWAPVISCWWLRFLWGHTLSDSHRGLSLDFQMVFREESPESFLMLQSDLQNDFWLLFSGIWVLLSATLLMTELWLLERTGIWLWFLAPPHTSSVTLGEFAFVLWFSVLSTVKCVDQKANSVDRVLIYIR